MAKSSFRIIFNIYQPTYEYDKPVQYVKFIDDIQDEANTVFTNYAEVRYPNKKKFFKNLSKILKL